MSQQINLFNADFLRRDKPFSLLAQVQGLGMIVLGALLFYAYAEYQVIDMGKQSVESTQRFNAQQAQLARYAAEFPPLQANHSLKEELQQLQKKAVEADKLVNTLRSGALGNTSGYSEYLRAFSRQALPGLWLTGFSVAGDTGQISLAGGALTPELVPAYIKKLGSESVMQGKTFANLQIQSPDVKDEHKVAHYVEFVLHSNQDEATDTGGADGLTHRPKAGKQ